MVTGDNPLTAKYIAEKAGVDDFIAEAKPCLLYTSCVNLPGPSGKAKYSRETDSEPVL